ncbi:MAG: CusA/CzcA family heavy metal efflux RND transporter [Flavobacteriaceae bacterium]
MLSKIIQFSLQNKLIILLFTVFIAGFGIYSLTQIPIGAVPDITNNQVQVITTSQNLSTQDIEQFITYPIELEMANLPGVIEIRSVSKFGLSVVTIVFEDDMGNYLPRQLIAEKIQAAKASIPQGFGEPEMGPITTGLGEIYQYILDVKPGYENRYNETDLRTIQDWIVKRQLAGIPGVVEVNTWGGKLKQYEVAITTEKLTAMNISIGEVMEALEKNNSVAGGAYIEKENQAYFIRGEGLVETIEDIENIVVAHRSNFPVYIKDIAKVGYGNANRFGAITGNGEGEKVLGQVMMLKDANSKKVIDAVKERVEAISLTLPEGIYINGFLDRSVLVDKTTFTITENLVLGCLIVIFVVVLLLGNLRSGLVVASVIPLCLLVALSLMYLFGVDANLMSLGAIDFGIIIDGAVIIVEFIAFQITKNQKQLEGVPVQQRRQLKDTITFNGASKMMNSAVFGQLIILIVFIPILSLSGVEGKMFRPMALTFSFALIGAMIMCFTYVPVMASLFIKPVKNSDKNISVKLINFLHRLHKPSINFALKSKKLILATAGILMVLAVYIFTTMGGEFIPTLDEGDFVIQPVLKTGTSLSKTIETTTQIETILIEKFPEIDQIVTRIGAAEVPTDPMSMEETDVIITLKPKKEWTSASGKDELADLFKEALSVIPGMEVEFTQPIEMRFNELITGVRADIAIKVFGEDLLMLDKKAREIETLIRNVDGAADIVVEKTVGLPQMLVKYDRSKIARYGLNIADLNQVISMGFAGSTMGVVFEGEKRFDLVLRLDESVRKDIQNLENLMVDTPLGQKIPLRELAAITYEKGAAKISRDDTRRRVVVGINVRNRDLQSVVDDVQALIDENITLPAGYSIQYGGQFENLQSAKDRLLVAVPVALLLIFILLYFAFHSVREALLVFTAIPLAAIGGIFMLWLRDMPFSISAGVGFIALFGIAVLNGIVLIEHYKDLKKEGHAHNDTLMAKGAADRLRAVLLTASAAALGFLPMAISTGAGAEVQRPLATVVIGGLISATLLTLIVLPVLYSLFGNTNKSEKKNTMIQTKTISLLLILVALPTFSQDRPQSLEQLKTLALENNAMLKSAQYEIEKAGKQKATSWGLDKTEVFYRYDENNLAVNDEPLQVYGLRQNLAFPTVYSSRKKQFQAIEQLQQTRYEVRKHQLFFELEQSYNHYLYAHEKAAVYQYLDSLFSRFAHAASRRFELGESNYLEKITAQAKQKNVTTQLQQARYDIGIAKTTLEQIVQSESALVPEVIPLEKKVFFPTSENSHPLQQWYTQNQEVAKAATRVEKQKLLPGIILEYFQGSNAGINRQLIGYQVGLQIPLWFTADKARIQAGKIQESIASEESRQNSFELKTRQQQFEDEVKKYAEMLDYFETEGLDLAKAIENAAGKSYQNGEIDFFQYIQSLENAMEIQLNYLETLYSYNREVLKRYYLLNANN